MTIAVASAADGAPWESALLSELGRNPSEQPFSVVRRCVDIVELLAVAGSGQAVAALVDAQLRRLDADAVERLTAGAVAVVGVTAPGADADTERLQDAGISHFVASDAPVSVFAAVITAAVAAQSDGGAGWTRLRRPCLRERAPSRGCRWRAGGRRRGRFRRRSRLAGARPARQGDRGLGAYRSSGPHHHGCHVGR